MKVAFVANTSWNIYNFRKGLVHHFLSKGHEVIVLSPRDDYTESIQKWDIKWIETPLDGTGVNPLKDFHYLNRILKTFKRERPTVALCFTIKSNIYSCLAGQLTSVPTICNVSGLGTVFLVEGLVAKLALQLYRIAFRFANWIFFQNEEDKELFLSKVKIPNNKIGLVPGSGINLDEFKFSPVIPKNPVKVLMISRLIIEKGVREYALVAENFKDDSRITFTLVGKLDETHSRSVGKAELDNWKANGLTYLPHSNKVKELIKEHEVIMLPSYREGTPRTLLEGGAIGRVLLASNVPGCKEVVVDGFNGFLFDVANVQNMMDKLKLYLSLSEEEKKQLSMNSRALIEEKFDENIVIDAYVEAINRNVIIA